MRASLAFATGSLLPPGIAIVDQAVRYHLFVLSDEQPVMFGAPFVDVLSLLAMAAWFGMASVSFLASREYASYARGGAPQEPRSTRLCLLAGIAQGMSLITLKNWWIGLLVFAALGPVFFRTQTELRSTNDMAAGNKGTEPG